ncbi:MAG: hypothetical protein IJ713_01335 [Oscillibacter sp.]|nr:hypothetical protein [Oscillibacter sp.]
MAVTEGTTSTGFAYRFDTERLDDMRFVDVLAELVDPDTPEFEQLIACSQLLTMMLGREQKQALYAHVAERNGGRAPVAAVQTELGEIMGNAGKNS